MSIIALVEGTHSNRFSMAMKELDELSEIPEVSETGFEASKELDAAPMTPHDEGGEGGPAPKAQVAKPSAAKEARAAKWASPQNNRHTLTRTSVIERADDMKDEEKDDALCAILDRSAPDTAITCYAASGPRSWSRGAVSCRQGRASDQRRHR